MEGSNGNGNGSSNIIASGNRSPPPAETSSLSTAVDGAENSESSSATPTASQTPRMTTSRTASSTNTATISSNTPVTSASSQPPSLRKQLSGSFSNAGSASASPGHSRNASPIRKDSTRVQPLAGALATQPSAAAIQRALSTASAPALSATSNSDSNPRISRRAGASSGDSTPQWPVSPRLKSPPPSASGNGSRRASTAGIMGSTAAVGPKKAESAATINAPIINVQAATPTGSSPALKPTGSEDAQKNSVPTLPPAKGPLRGPSGKSTLETVQENSADDIKAVSPAALQAAADLKPLTTVTEEDPDKPAPNREGEAQQVESGSESAEKSSERKQERIASVSQTSVPQRPKSVTKLSSVKLRQPEGKQGMTVETETVPSIPQSALNAGERSGARNEPSGSVRLKPSNETIRPKKERKKASQKPRSVNQSSASSKADIFEARVANAVDEANSSDSDETFVYESNPPEQQRRTRHHSRTPSVTSSHSIADQNRTGTRTFAEASDDRRVAGKRSMKFSNNLYNDLDSPDNKDGSVRSHQPRHFGRFGRGGSHASMFDPESTYTPASKLRPSQFHSQRRSRPNSPRSPHGNQHRSSALLSRKQEMSYDMDVEAADDERTPLMGTVRTSRADRSGQRIHMSHSPDIDEYYGVRRHSRCGRFGGCLLGFCILVLVVLSAVGFLVISNQQLAQVKILKVRNVLASEQELMFDLCVGAINPNTFAVTITDLNVDVFAKSRYVGIDRWRNHGRIVSLEDTAFDDTSDHHHSPNPRPPTATTGHGIDKGTSPTDDLERDSQTMLLGRMHHFDQALVFEGSPFKRIPSFSTGTLRLEQPGNKTETNGSDHWEHVLLHPFDLIVKGILRYNLPISQRPISAGVQGVVRVDVDEDAVGDPSGSKRVVVSGELEVFDLVEER